MQHRIRVVAPRIVATLLMAATFGAACAVPAPKSGDTAPADTAAPVGVATPTGPTGDQEWDKAVIAQLERDARRLANGDGCTDVGQCRVAPYGVKACGGPRGYFVYCAVATDSAALFQKLDQLARLERAYNQRYEVASTCELREAPDVALVGRTCRGATR